MYLPFKGDDMRSINPAPAYPVAVLNRRSFSARAGPVTRTTAAGPKKAPIAAMYSGVISTSLRLVLLSFRGVPTRGMLRWFHRPRDFQMIDGRNRIVWVASYPRSGGTWTRMLLFNLVQIMSGSREACDINALGDFSPWDAKLKYYRKYLKQGFENAPFDEVVAARHQVHQDIADKAAGRVFVKTHWPLCEIGSHESVNRSVTAGAIYLVRNPLDVAISFAHHFMKPIDTVIEILNTAGSHMISDGIFEFWGSWSDHVASWTHQTTPTICCVRYEDLLSDPERWFGVVAHHVFEPAPSTEQLRAAIANTSFAILRNQEEKRGFKDTPAGAPQSVKFFREGRAGQWQQHLSTVQVDCIVSSHREQMERFSYLPLHRRQ
jgi:hypothetical protein